MEEKLPADAKQYLAKHKIRFYTIDAVDIAREIGLGNRIMKLVYITKKKDYS